MAEGENNDAGAAAAAADAGKGADAGAAAADAGKAAADAGKTADAGKAAADAKAATDAEAARVAALTPEQKAAEEAAAKAKGEGDKGKTTDAPADYTALKMPDGYKADDPVFAEAVKMFGDLKIAPADAQKLLDFTVNRDKELVKAVNDGQAANWGKQVDEWKADTAKNVSAEDLGLSKTAFEKVFDPATAKYLEGLGFTNHRGFVEAMAKIGKAIKDDTFVAGNAANGAGSDARRMFPNSNMNP